MDRTKNSRIVVLCFACMLYLCVAGNTQVVAGISANGTVMIKGDTINVCRGSDIIYESVAQGTTTVSWRFNNGSPLLMTGIGPFRVTYNTNGYDTTFQRAGTGAFADSMFIIVRVADEKPVAGYDLSANNICGNEKLQFNNTTVNGAPFRYFWDFGDGTTSFEDNPAHQYLDAIGSGTQNFSVKLVVINANTCVDSVTHTVTVKSVPDAAIGKADPNVTVGVYKDTISFRNCDDKPFYNFKFTNNSPSIATNTLYAINWGDGTADTVFASWPAGTVINHNFLSGSSTMTVSVTGASGCVGIKKYIVYVGIFPYGTLSYPAGINEICETDSLSFKLSNTDDNSPGTSYIFYINDFSEGQFFQHPNPTVIGQRFTKNSCSYLSDDGSQVFTNSLGAYLLIQNPCGVYSSSVVPIYVSGKPRPDMYVSSTTTCVNSFVKLINTSGYGNIVTPTVGITSTCENKGKNVWAITPATGYTIASGVTGSLNGNLQDPALWTDGADSLDIQFMTAGVYAVKIYIGNERCGLDSTIATITVKENPLTVDPEIAYVCGNDTTINFVARAQPAGDGAATYKWFVNDNLMGTSNALTHHFKRLTGGPQEFTIRLEAQGVGGCDQTTVTAKVIFSPSPDPTIQVSPALVQQQPNYEFTFKEVGPGNANYFYSWTMGDRFSQIKEGQHVVYQYRDTGTYHVVLEVKDVSTGCGAIDSVAVSVLAVPGYIQVPNAICPGCTDATLRKFLPLAKGLREYRLSIYTAWGQKIFESTSLDANGSPNESWDGTLNGKQLQQDVYNWQIEGTFKNGTEWTGMIYPGQNKPVKMGFITVIK